MSGGDGGARWSGDSKDLENLRDEIPGFGKEFSEMDEPFLIYHK